MKKNLTLLIGVFILSLSVNAQSIDEQKEALKRIWIIQTAMNASNANYTAPGEYKINDTTQNIEGQVFYSFGQWKYHDLKIDFSKKFPTKALFREGINTEHSLLTLTWEDGQLVSMVQKFRAGTYTIAKDADSYTVNKAETINRQPVCKVTYCISVMNN